MVGGTARDFTDICGDTLNYTTSVPGDYYVMVSLESDMYINETIITEGYTVRNVEQLSGIRYLLPAFFEYRNRPNRVVEFRDASKESGSVYVTKVLWNFGDGQTATGMDVEHTYPLPGIYNTTATVWFSDGTIQFYSTQVEVTADVISWWAYAVFSCLIFTGILAVGVYAARKKSKRILAAMWGLLGLFVAITVIIMQFAVE